MAPEALVAREFGPRYQPSRLTPSPSPPKAHGMKDLKLIALDAEDLRVLSCHLQDAVIRVDDMAYLKDELRFAALASRFDWEAAAGADGSYQRRRAGVRFERVLGAQVQGIDLKDRDGVFSLLAITFEPAEAPAGTLTLHFAGGAAVRLKVECVEAELRDLGAVWSTPVKPDHPGENTSTD
jgi:hypothetical protein